MQAHTSQPEHIKGLDSIRALAVLSVMGIHLLSPNFSGFLKYAFTGRPAVTVFFIISGFCIHYPYINAPLPAKAFLAARWLRLAIPAAIAMCFAKAAHINTYNFWDGAILWSLLCELIYYSLYPCLLKLSKTMSFRRQYLLALVISCDVVLWHGISLHGNSYSFGPYLNWIVSLPYWLLGCVLAETMAAQKMQASRIPIYAWRLGMACIASTLYCLTVNTVFGYYMTLPPFAILMCFWIKAEIGSPISERAYIEKMGRWSYSIYLMHLPIYYLLIAYAGSVPFVLLPLILCLCYLFYRIIELPSHRFARHIFRKLSYRNVQ